MNDPIFGLLLLTGLLGSIGHCLGMCGPLVMMVGVQVKASNNKPLPRHLLYHGSRITVYALLGTIAGVLGSFAAPLKPLGLLGGALSIALGVGVLVLGLAYLGWIRKPRASGLRQRLNPMMGWALNRRGMASAAALGGLSGLLPCGLVYGALLAAASTGTPLAGGSAMLVFGIGTVPALLLAGLSAGLVSTQARAVFAKIAGVMMLIVALQLSIRGFAVLGLAPHLQLGSVMLW